MVARGKGVAAIKVVAAGQGVAAIKVVPAIKVVATGNGVAAIKAVAVKPLRVIPSLGRAVAAIRGDVAGRAVATLQR